MKRSKSILLGMWIAFDPTGVIVGHKHTHPEASEFVGMSLVEFEETRIEPLRDELGVYLWSWDGTKVIPRPEVAADRYKALAPERLKAFRIWQDAVQLQSADPSAITTAEVESLHTKYEEAKALK